MKTETEYQRSLIKKLEQMFPGCFITKNDASANQGIPDILILFRNRWAMLEVKKSTKAKVQPNQQHYVNQFDEMSFASFISPENEVEVLDELQSAFQSRRKTRISKP